MSESSATNQATETQPVDRAVFAAPTGEAVEMPPPLAKIAVTIGRSILSANIVVDFSDDSLKEDLLKKYNFINGLPPSSSEQVPNQPHVFEAETLVVQSGKTVNLGKTKVLAAHGYQKRDQQTGEDKWSFYDGRSVEEVVKTYNNEARLNGIDPIQTLAVCNNNASSQEGGDVVLGSFTDQITFAVGSDVKYSLVTEQNGNIQMSLGLANPNGHFFIANNQ